MITFPRGRYVDQVDALSWIGLGLNTISPTYTQTDIAKFEYEEEFGEEFNSLMSGRSRITGY